MSSNVVKFFGKVVCPGYNTITCHHYRAHRNLARGGGYVAGAIGFIAPEDDLRLVAAGAFDFTGVIDGEHVSDHLPLWAELGTRAPPDGGVH